MLQSGAGGIRPVPRTSLAFAAFIVYRRYTMNCPQPPDSAGCDEDRRLSAQMSAMSHPVRIAILRQLAATEGCCCKDVVCSIDLAQSTVSQHLKTLVDAGLVRFSVDRQRSRYMLDRDALRRFSDGFAGLVDACCPPDGTKRGDADRG